ncbi:putative xenobiotic-transporting ATPase [Rosa chinensis]|uniref:ABC-type xenobiotic transporter n=1 Tax=Rosa chinensis TaxID=74649 RepID=A0A2P6SQM3_ROSCH|nr:putative xenobiotic-transporting ATPase [Rosa chinensis]
MMPIQISLAIYILHTNLGMGSLAALAATLAVLLCNIPMTNLQKRYQTRIMEAKDNRMKATSEILRSMKTIKLQAWDSQFLQKLESLRKVEYGWLWKSLRLSATTAFVFWGSPTFISVVTFWACMLMGIDLTAGRVLSALATFRMLQDPIFNLPDLLSAIAQGKVSADRVASYLMEDEIQQDGIEHFPKDQMENSIEIENGNLAGILSQATQLLMEYRSGKSSLLSCILGEIQKLSGTVKISGTKAYVPQSPWILTGNIRENILFGNAYDKAKYDRTVKACALEKDFELFSCGDLTEIGERGINMSGGQKQRIQIARAVYQDADIYLLDDPLDCMMGLLREKTTLYVTHQVEFLPAADIILSILTVENSSRTTQDPTPESEPIIESTSDAELQQTRQESEHNLSLEITEKEGKLVQDEEREKGSIGKEVYWSYLTTVKGGVLIPIIILAQSSFQVLQVASNYWMAWASPPTSETEPKFTMCAAACIASSSSRTFNSTKLFTTMLHSVLRAPMSFFDSTPTGRILNRASTDQSVLDLEMATRLGWCAFSIIQILGTIAVMSQVAWEVFVIFIPVTAICIWYQQYYIPTARELARLSGIQRAPILHHFAESLAGAATIRAFDQQDRFSDANLSLIDSHSRPWFHNVSAMEWLSFRLNILSNFVFAFSLVLLVTLPEGVINPSIAGLAVTYGINLNVLQASVIWNMCNAENKMISVERILQYSNLTSEAALVIEDSKPPMNWPQLHISGTEQSWGCRKDGQWEINPHTGLFRIVEPREGSIIIDDVDICKIGLHDLRSRLSIIPQDPTMFEGTVRGNLDPLEQYSDNDVWEALDKCQLGDLVRAKEEKLEASVVENGENWSAGQRQLVCLGRALLKKSRILVLDEATASVDSATDGVIQKIISQEFKDRTVVTIAHRIHTVIDSDLVLVLSDGRIAEYDTPAKLLEREESLFSKLIKEYSMRSQSFNSFPNLHN